MTVLKCSKISNCQKFHTSFFILIAFLLCCEMTDLVSRIDQMYTGKNINKLKQDLYASKIINTISTDFLGDLSAMAF